MRGATFDWQAIRERLQASEESLQQALSESPERIKTVFHQRAMQLAKSHAGSEPVSRGIPSLVFRLAQERYAIALKDLAEVLPFQGCTQVPGTPPQFLGVINLRGELRPVINLARVLSGGESTDSGAILILHRQAGLKVDDIEDLREIQPEEFVPHSHGRYIQGLAHGPVMVLDVEAMLSAEFSPKESGNI